MEPQSGDDLLDVIEGETEEFYEIKEVHYDENDQALCIRGAMPMALKLWSLCVKWLPVLHEAFDNPVLVCKRL
jgi:hypothetical protein